MQERRVERWCRDFPRGLEAIRDADGFPWRHTYFFPAEQYDRAHVERLSAFCRAGWGEIEVQLHHGVDAPDTPENERQVLREYVDRLVRHGCLSRWEGAGAARYAFVHGNWALANTYGGLACGVDNELQILADTGCYADLTLPSAPHPSQVSKVNSLYECALPLEQRAAHRRGFHLRAGRPPAKFPIIVQGPLLLNFRSRGGMILPGIENAALTSNNPPSLSRLRLWQRAGISVQGRSDWLVIKLHCHGMDPRDEELFLGPSLRSFLGELVAWAAAAKRSLHFVTARQLVNILLAACDGQEGDPGAFRDYRLRLITSVKRA
jgi:hypothetical protein